MNHHLESRVGVGLRGGGAEAPLGPHPLDPPLSGYKEKKVINIMSWPHNFICIIFHITEFKFIKKSI